MILPSHIAIIMDGNGRWGLKKYNDRNKGHYYGLQNINKVIEHCINLKIKYLTLYTFSTENWNRPKKEINYLFYLFKYFYKENFNKLNKNNIRIKFIGDLINIPKDLKPIIKKIHKNKNNKISEELISNNLYTKNMPDPDILVRTVGEKRLSNF